MSARFTFLSDEEFACLGSGEKADYLSDAMAELEQAKSLHAVRGWHSGFRQGRPQEEPPVLPEI